MILAHRWTSQDEEQSVLSGRSSCCRPHCCTVLHLNWLTKPRLLPWLLSPTSLAFLGSSTLLSALPHRERPPDILEFVQQAYILSSVPRTNLNMSTGFCAFRAKLRTSVRPRKKTQYWFAALEVRAQSLVSNGSSLPPKKPV